MKDTAWPRWRYHRELKPEGKIVRSFEENEALGPNWVDSPAQFDLKPEVPPAETEVATNEEAQEMISGGEAEIPDSAIVSSEELAELTKPEVPTKGRGGRKKKGEA